MYQAGNSAHRLFQRLPPSLIRKLGERISKLALSHGLTYVNEKGRTMIITLTLRPRLIHKKKMKVLWQTIRILDGAFRKVASLYFQNPRVQELFPFEPREQDWISMMEDPGYQPGQIASRWDANTTFGEEEWKEGFSFFEVNGVGIGGIWYGPACADVSMKTVVPELKKLDSHFSVCPTPDMRPLLLNLLLRQGQRLGRKRGVIALVIEKASGGNFIEFERLAKLYSKWGYPTIVAEPTEIHLKKEELSAKGKRIDLVYRDTTLLELCHLEETGHNLRALREGFRRGQVISSLEGEFDHKSVFELFTSPEYAKCFDRKESELFRRHILWTRLLRETRTTDPQGKSVDLVPFILKNQSHFVLKPNRLYGGKGVLFGEGVKRREWERKIEAALEEPGAWVVQQLGKVRKKRFCRPGRKIEEKELYVVSGFFATEKGLGVVGRMSERKIVNVARQGGLTPILLIK